MDIPLRRKKQLLPEEEAWECLRQTEFGILSTVDEDGWPYGVPLNHVVLGEKIYFHGASEGHKMISLAYSSKACYTVVASAQVIPEELATRYRSVICFGTVRRLTDPEERDAVLWKLAERFAPDEIEFTRKEMVQLAGKTTVLELDVQRITGKYHS